MKQYNFTFKGTLTMEGAEEHLLDNICDQLKSNLKDTLVKSTVGDYYKNFNAELENGIELDCELSWDDRDNEWYATAWQMDGEIEITN
ncbi:hypothetical protein [Cytobacillus praedii]|uniref:Uncharacterized protein n=1 Tax=Cytobacillus praedii TaxID=1742358 RepID=A0A4R1AKE8_9BACI|nr:hypothetical protein [Cytobacillus praedii]TCI99977.1 hypothetical protein E0Y62_27105 [Cytobacillus praedii]